MDHSVEDYLERRTTAELKNMLQYYLKEDRCADNIYAITQILQVLAKRPPQK